MQPNQEGSRTCSFSSHVGLTHQEGAQNRFLDQQSDTSRWFGRADSELERMLIHVLKSDQLFLNASSRELMASANNMTPLMYFI